MQAGLEITRVDQGDRQELLVSGRMDGYWSRHLEEAIDEVMREGIHHISVNLSKTEYISSAGIRVLLRAFKQFSTVKGTFLVVEPSEIVRNILDMAGLGTMLCAPADRHSEAADAPEPVTQYVEEECSFEVYEYHPGAQLTCRAAGRSWCRTGTPTS